MADYLEHNRPACITSAGIQMSHDNKLNERWSHIQFSVVRANAYGRIECCYCDRHYPGGEGIPHVLTFLFDMRIMRYDDYIQLIRDSIKMPSERCNDKSIHQFDNYKS